MKNVLVVNPSKINEVYQDDLLVYNRPVEVYYGGAGSGKSIFVIQKIILKWHQRRGRTLIVRKTETSIEQSTFTDVQNVLKSMGLLDKCVISKKPFKITFLNGSELIFRGVDDVEKLKSIADINDVWFEEATEFTFEEYNQIRLRTRGIQRVNPQVFVTFNPVSKANWVYKKLYMEKDIDKQLYFKHTTYLDNKFLDDEYINTLTTMARTAPDYYKIYALGEFVSLGKLIFERSQWKTYSKIDIDNFSPSDGWQPFSGADWGYTNDPTVILGGFINPSKYKIYITYHRRVFNADTREIAKIIKEDGVNQIYGMIYGDNQKRIIDELALRHGVNILPAKKGNDSVIGGLELLKPYEIYIQEDEEELIEEFENYAYKKNKQGDYIDEPIDEYNHGIDALRYGFEPYKTAFPSIDITVEALGGWI